jgi:hypothetical protein
MMNMIVDIAHREWDAPASEADRAAAIDALENGQVVHLPQLGFTVSPDEQRFLDPKILAKAKNVSFTPWTGKVGGTVLEGADAEALRAMLERFSKAAHALMKHLFPHYQGSLRSGRASLRPAEIAGRKSSWRKDDSRLHVDAFPTMPTHGERIIRVFTNVNPHGKPRVWRVGEPFEDVAKRFAPGIARPLPGSAWFMHLVRLTKKRRSEYDHYMLHLHDAMKADVGYQGSVGKEPVEFRPGTTWITFTDQVSHAALSGQHQFEQTFNLPIAGMLHPERSPLKVLERVVGRGLI